MVKYPVVSVIIPSLNSEAFIGDAIKSIKKQDYPNIEIIVVDGDSTDNTSDILSNFDDIIIIKEKDNGQAEAINKGFKKSKGDILFWLNADDIFISKNVVSSVVRIFSAHPEIGAVYTDYVLINHRGDKLLNRREIDFDLNVLLFGPNFIGVSAFIRKIIYQDNKPLDETVNFTMDLEYWLRLATSGVKFGHVREIGLGLRYHDSCKSVAKRSNMVAEGFMVRKKYTEQFFPRRTKWLRVLYYFYRLKRQYLKLTTLKTMDIPFRISILRRLAMKRK